MLVTVSNFKGIIQISAINNTGNPRVDIVGNEWVEEAISRYEPEFFNKAFGLNLYNYLLTYSDSDSTILSLISQVTEAAACYVYNNILRERKGTYNGSTIQNVATEGSNPQPIEDKAIEVHNRMVKCIRNAMNTITDTLWNEQQCYMNKSFIEYQLC